MRTCQSVAEEAPSGPSQPTVPPTEAHSNSGICLCVRERDILQQNLCLIEPSTNLGAIFATSPSSEKGKKGKERGAVREGVLNSRQVRQFFLPEKHLCLLHLFCLSVHLQERRWF